MFRLVRIFVHFNLLYSSRVLVLNYSMLPCCINGHCNTPTAFFSGSTEYYVQTNLKSIAQKLQASEARFTLVGSGLLDLNSDRNDTAR